jgi:hypothetical protein
MVVMGSDRSGDCSILRISLLYPHHYILASRKISLSNLHHVIRRLEQIYRSEDSPSEFVIGGFLGKRIPFGWIPKSTSHPGCHFFAKKDIGEFPETG